MNDNVLRFVRLYKEAYDNIGILSDSAMWEIYSYDYTSKEINICYEDVFNDCMSYSLLEIYLRDYCDGINCDDMLLYMKSLGEFIMPYEVINCISWDDFESCDLKREQSRMFLLNLKAEKIREVLKGINNDGSSDANIFISLVYEIFSLYTNGNDIKYKSCTMIRALNNFKNIYEKRNIVSCIKSTFNSIIDPLKSYLDKIESDKKIVKDTIYSLERMIVCGCGLIAISYNNYDDLELIRNFKYEKILDEELKMIEISIDDLKKDNSLKDVCKLGLELEFVGYEDDFNHKFFQYFGRFVDYNIFTCMEFNVCRGITSLERYFEKRNKGTKHNPHLDFSIQFDIEDYLNIIVPWRIRNNKDDVDLSVEKEKYNNVLNELDSLVERCKKIDISFNEKNAKELILMLIDLSIFEICLYDKDLSKYDYLVLNEFCKNISKNRLFNREIDFNDYKNLVNVVLEYRTLLMMRFDDVFRSYINNDVIKNRLFLLKRHFEWFLCELLGGKRSYICDESLDCSLVSVLREYSD